MFIGLLAELGIFSSNKKYGNDLVFMYNKPNHYIYIYTYVRKPNQIPWQSKVASVKLALFLHLNRCIILHCMESDPISLRHACPNRWKNASALRSRHSTSRDDHVAVWCSNVMEICMDEKIVTFFMLFHGHPTRSYWLLDVIGGKHQLFWLSEKMYQLLIRFISFIMWIIC